MSLQNIIFSLGLLMSTASLSAQSTYQQLLPAANNGTTTTGTGYTWSLGDIYTADLTGSLEIISRVEEDLALTHGLRLIGNPTAAITRLEIDDAIPLSYQVFDLNGRVLISRDAGRHPHYEVDLSDLPPQIYLLSVFTTEGKRPMATYRVQKQ